MGNDKGYAKKTEAEDAAKNVAGVTALVEKIKVKYPSSYSKTNAEIANEVLTALKARWDVPQDKVKVKVEVGWITLAGEVGWNFQREAAKDAIKSLIRAPDWGEHPMADATWSGVFFSA